MKKILKFMSLLLIVPVLGIGSLLSGCGKDEASINDIKIDYNKMIFAYQTGTEDKNFAAGDNKLFTFTTSVAMTAEGTYDYFKNTAADKNDTVQNNKITFDIDLGSLEHTVTTAGKSDELKSAYAQLQNESIYASLLNYSNKYFERYQNDFFGTAREVDAEQLFELREKLDVLSDSLESFYSNLLNRQSLADFLGKDTEIMRTKLYTFNSVYVDLIEANFEFVLKFCDIHKNYILDADSIAQESVRDQVIAERYTYEAALKLAYGYFLDNVKSYDKNGLCDSYKLTTSDIEDESFVLTDEVITAFEKIRAYESGTLGIKANKAAELKQAVARIDAFTKLYKTNAESFDVYTYNLLRTKSDESLYKDINEFEESLSAADKAKLTMIKSYSEYDLPLLVDAVYNMFGNN